MKNQLSILILAAFFSAAAFSATPIVRYGDLRLSFEENRGQTNGQVKFLAHGHGYTLFLTGREAVLAAPKAAAIHMSFLGANPTPRVSGTDQLPGKSNYFIGSDPAKWRSNVPTFAKVKYESIYPGVDLIYYGNQQRLEYDFAIAPGADPRRIQFHIRGAKKISLSADGDLVLRTNGGEIRWHKPVVYQEMDGVRREIAGRYDIQGGNRVGFEVADYDRGKRLIVDPVLSYSTYLGGSGGDVGTGIAVDSFGSAYVSGTTLSANFPVSKGTPSSTFSGIFVTKFDPSGSTLIYSTYIGGSAGTGASGIAIDSLGDAYVTGSAGADFPTVNPLQKAYGGNEDAFVLELDQSGSTLVYSTYLGGKRYDVGTGIAVDSLGAAYVTGSTASRTFPLMNPLKYVYSASGQSSVAFVAKINPLGAGLAYSTYLGGNRGTGNAIAVDSLGDAYITGSTNSVFPTTPHSFQPRAVGTTPAFVAELNPSGSDFVYSTFLGGDESGGSGDTGYAIAVDSSGDAYVTGVVASKTFPTVNPVQKNLRGATNAFVTELNPSGSALIFSTYLGGNYYSEGTGIALDSSGNVYVVGGTESTSNFPLLNPLQSFNAGNGDSFVAELNPSGSALIYSTYLGGSGDDSPTAIAVDSSGNAYITGQTSSTDLPTHNPLQAAHGGGTSDAFVAKLATTPGQAPTTTVLTSSLNPSVFGQTVNFTAKVRSDGSIPPDGETVTFRQGATLLANVELTGGAASFSTSTMIVGEEGITASFSGTASLASSVSPTVEQVINKATTSTTLTSAQNPSAAGTTMVLTAKVSAQYSGTPHGSVVFKAGTQPLATVTLIDGVAEYATSELAKGSYTITANYEGNANFETSTASLTQTVQ